MKTIREIAEILGVSSATVSNVVNGHTEKMSEQTRRMVEEALKKYEFHKTYREPDHSKALKLVTVDFFLHHKEKIMMDPFCSELLDAICAKLQEYGRYPVCGMPSQQEEIHIRLQANNIQGGLIVGVNPWECQKFAENAGKPVVFVDCGEGEYDNVGIDDFEGGRLITDFLLSQGHRKIAFFCDRKNPVSSNFERYRGYTEALSKYEIAASNEDYYYLPDDKNQRRETLRYFANHVKEKGYTAAVVVSDLLANEAINIFFAEGLSVPEDISVTGFDDNIYAKMSRPTLTTVRQTVADKGEQAVKLLMQRIRHEDVLVRTYKLPVELIVRESVANFHL